MKQHTRFRKKIVGDNSPAILWRAILSLCVCFVTGFLNPAGAEVVDRILAVVNDDIITLYEFNNALRPYETRIRSLGYPAEKEKQVLSKIHDDILNQLIDGKLAEQEIKRTNLSVSEDEINSALERFKATNGMTDEGLRVALESEGLSLTEYRQRLKEQILRSKLVNRQVKSKIVITQEEIRAYYENHPERFGPQKRLRLRQILMRTPAGMDEEDKALQRKKMEAVIDEINKGKSFVELARNYSEVLAQEGGMLGLFDLEELSKPLQAALNGKQAGYVTEIIQTDQGFQLVYIDEIVTVPGKDLERVTAEIEDILFQELVKERYDDWLKDLKSRSIVKRIE